MNDNILQLVRQCAIFSSLDDDALNSISLLVEPLSLNQDEVLFRQGDPSFYFYILISGTLIAMASNNEGHKFVGTIEQGETVGELGAISGESRTLTVKATQNSTLLKLSNNHLIDICQKYPNVMVECVKTIISRSQKNIKLLSPENECNLVGLIISKKDRNHKKIKEILIENTNKNQETHVISDSEIDPLHVLNIINALEKKHQNILFILDSENSDNSKIILQKIHSLYIFQPADCIEGLDPFTIHLLNHQEYQRKIRFSLILIHHEKDFIHRNTKKWTEKFNFMKCHHVRINVESDYQRMLRFFSGKANGLVLGGGGTRGWMHIGVIKALMEAKIPIDAISGTSIGSLFGIAYILSHGDFDRMIELSKDFMKSSGPPYTPKDFTLPLVSILSGERITKGILNICDDICIEDLWLPYFCITTNISTYKEECHHFGLCYESVRASIALPGIFPPMVINNQLHFDGGLSNNLPVDEMRKIVGKKGTIYASCLTSFRGKNTKFTFPPILTFKELIYQKLGVSKQPLKFPNFYETFYSIITYGSFAYEKEQGENADILINPDISKYGIMSLKENQLQELIDIGYNELSAVLKKKNGL